MTTTTMTTAATKTAATKAAAVKAAEAKAAAVEAAEGLGATVDRLLDQLAKRKGIADRHYDATLRSYERSLRRFTEYVAEKGEEAALRAGPDEVIEGYLRALLTGDWPAPSSEAKVARIATNHLRAFLVERRR